MKIARIRINQQERYAIAEENTYRILNDDIFHSIAPNGEEYPIEEGICL